MNNTHGRRIFELIYELTQKGRVVSFERDFAGMLNVNVSGEDHQHIGAPHGNLEDLAKQLRHYLASVCEWQWMDEVGLTTGREGEDG